jgi:tetratricopeptide (TPR) repeat protein
VGVFFTSRGRYEEAEPHVRKAIAMWTANLGRNHEHTASGTGNLAFVLHGMDRLDEADTLYREALMAHQAAHEAAGAEGPWTSNHLGAARNFGVCLHHQERLAEAAEQLLETEERYREADLVGHVDYAYLLGALGSLYVELAKQQDAEEALVRCLEIFADELDTAVGPIPWAQNSLATCLAAQGRTRQAESLFAQSSPDAWTCRDYPPASKRIAWERARQFYESIGRADRINEMQATRP